MKEKNIKANEELSVKGYIKIFFKLIIEIIGLHYIMLVILILHLLFIIFAKKYIKLIHFNIKKLCKLKQKMDGLH